MRGAVLFSAPPLRPADCKYFVAACFSLNCQVTALGTWWFRVNIGTRSHRLNDGRGTRSRCGRAGRIFLFRPCPV